MCVKARIGRIHQHPLRPRRCWYRGLAPVPVAPEPSQLNHGEWYNDGAMTEQGVAVLIGIPPLAHSQVRCPATGESPVGRDVSSGIERSKALK